MPRNGNSKRNLSALDYAAAWLCMFTQPASQARVTAARSQALLATFGRREQCDLHGLRRPKSKFALYLDTETLDLAIICVHLPSQSPGHPYHIIPCGDWSPVPTRSPSIESNHDFSRPTHRKQLVMKGDVGATKAWTDVGRDKQEAVFMTNWR